MPGLDLFLSRYLSNEIKKKFDVKILRKLERKLFLDYGMSIKLSMEHCDTFNTVLKFFYDDNPQQFIQNCLDKVIQVKKTKNQYTIMIIDPSLSKKICDYFGDPESRRIITSVMGKQLTIPDILKDSKVLKSPAYRKIENLVLDGILLEHGKILTNNKRVSQYMCIFEELRIIIKSRKLIIECNVNPKFFRESSLVKSGLLSL